MTPLDYKKKFIAIYNATIKREGADTLLQFLEESDFFTAPASTRYHGSHPGGLCEHSINVYECLCDYLKRPRARELYGMNYTEETIAIVSLLHDVCKTNFYVETTRNVKEDGVWKTVPYYSIEDQLPYGHGEKSVYMISAYMKLTRDEAFAIRYHMGFSESNNVTYLNNVGKAYEMFPIAFAVSVADMEASYYLEEVGK
ncbi:MAG: hydrolase [Clostridia bacterium]|nr:hydrolase [Clostridia bacterium]